jgi:hypothetical protein
VYPRRLPRAPNCDFSHANEHSFRSVLTADESEEVRFSDASAKVVKSGAITYDRSGAIRRPNDRLRPSKSHRWRRLGRGICRSLPRWFGARSKYLETASKYHKTHAPSTRATHRNAPWPSTTRNLSRVPPNRMAKYRKPSWPRTKMTVPDVPSREPQTTASKYR